MTQAPFTEEQVQRYARHIILPNIGGAGQRKLLDASVLCIGAGGLGSPIAMYLAAAGIGKLGVVDFDHVDVSNLQRQILHTDGDVGRPKVESAVVRLVPLAPQELPQMDWGVFAGIIAGAFSARRKKLSNALPLAAADFEALGLDPALRPENLSPQDYVRVAQRLTCASR